MSIWESWQTVGEPAPDEAGGTVRAYINGWSNHYPDETEPPATVDIASIPGFCVPGHPEDDAEDDDGNFDQDHEVYTSKGPWLRLGILARRAVSVGDNGLVPDPKQATVVMDEAAVRALRDQLTDWLNWPKLHPTQEDE